MSVVDLVVRFSVQTALNITIWLWLIVGNMFYSNTVTNLGCAATFFLHTGSKEQKCKF